MSNHIGDVIKCPPLKFFDSGSQFHFHEQNHDKNCIIVERLNDEHSYIDVERPYELEYSFVLRKYLLSILIENYPFYVYFTYLKAYLMLYLHPYQHINKYL